MKEMINSAFNAVSAREKVTVIKPQHGWRVIDFRELWEYRDLFLFLTWRDIKVLYAQTILGFIWAILQPLLQILIFTVIFSKVAKLSSDGFPYFLFSAVAVIPWNYMSQAMSQSSQSLVTYQMMLGKIYFPRLVFPLTPVLARLLDFAISIIIILFVLFFYKIHPSWNLLFLPIFLIMMMAVPAGIGMWLSALAIRFRDVKFAMPFVMRMLVYTAPIVYSASTIPEKYRIVYSLNPIVGVIEGFRSCLLGTPVPWLFIVPGIITSILFLVSGAKYFKKMERVFVDVI
jgi:lipopolysaccharide transport system permease protein